MRLPLSPFFAAADNPKSARSILPVRKPITTIPFHRQGEANQKEKLLWCLKRRCLLTPCSRRLEIKVSDWKPFEKNTLKGILTVTVPAIGLSIRDCMYHVKGESRWIGFPGKRYENNGIAGYTNFVEFNSKQAHYAFQEAALAALDAYLSPRAQ
jgi:hypothetical protein